MYKRQHVYDAPDNLFVARFLGTPPIDVLTGSVRGGKLYAGNDELCAASGIDDREVFIGIRPEGFVLDKNGPLHCALNGVEVMGRDVSVVFKHEAATTPTMRAIISSESSVDILPCLYVQFLLFAEQSAVCLQHGANDPIDEFLHLLPAAAGEVGGVEDGLDLFARHHEGGV